jgi:hypothetical protein
MRFEIYHLDIVWMSYEFSKFVALVYLKVSLGWGVHMVYILGMNVFFF